MKRGYISTWGRLIALLAILCLFGSILTGCSNSNTLSGKYYYYPDSGEIEDEWYFQFNNDNTVIYYEGSESITASYSVNENTVTFTHKGESDHATLSSDKKQITFNGAVFRKK